MSDERRNASESVGSNDEVLQWVTFKLDRETYGINVMQVQEVLRYTAIAPVPGAPSYVMGIINLRGNVVTVIDTRARFGLDTAEITDHTRIVIIEAEKQFLIIGSINALIYIEVFPLVKNNQLWLGNGFHAGNAYFATPFAEEYGSGVYMPETGLVKFRNVCWLTNIDHGRRHQLFPLMTTEDNLKYSKHKEVKGKESYDKYDNYDAIEVPFTDAIPSDYGGPMGVPISFMDKYNPDQFEIIKFRKGNNEKDLSINGKCPYFRILIKNKRLQHKYNNSRRKFKHI